MHLILTSEPMPRRRAVWHVAARHMNPAVRAFANNVCIWEEEGMFRATCLLYVTRGLPGREWRSLSFPQIEPAVAALKDRLTHDLNWFHERVYGFRYPYEVTVEISREAHRVVVDEEEYDAEEEE